MKSLLFPIISIIAAIGLYFFFISPQLAVVSELTLKDEEFTQSLSDVKEIQGIIGRLESNYASITREDLERLERFLPRDFDHVRVSRDLDAYIARDQVEVAGITVQKSRSKKNNDEEVGLEEHLATVNFFANYENFKNILNGLEQNLQVARIDSVSFTPPKGESEDRLGLGLNAYTLKMTYYSFDNREE